MTEKGRQTGSAGDPAEPAREQIVIKDKRKIDKNPPSAKQSTGTHAAPEPDVDEGEQVIVIDDGVTSGEIVVDEPAPAEAKPSDLHEHRSIGAELEALRAERDEHVLDLQRMTAEYANYRKRVERDRSLMAEQAVGNVLSALLPILDDLDRAREHGDLVGPFAGVAEQLNAALAKFGLTGFGEPGDPFDPTRHEAVAHSTSAEVTEPTCVSVMRRGYLLGERLLRPALVGVADPA